MAVFEVNFFAYTLNRRVPVNVILPTDKFYFPGMKKREEGKPYKTLYLLHGVTDNYSDWLYKSQILQFAEERDLAVVMPSGENSFSMGGYGAIRNALLTLSKDMSDFLTVHGVEHTFETGRGNHEWDFWNRYIKRIIDWLPLE